MSEVSVRVRAADVRADEVAEKIGHELWVFAPRDEFLSLSVLSTNNRVLATFPDVSDESFAKLYGLLDRLESGEASIWQAGDRYTLLEDE